MPYTIKYNQEKECIEVVVQGELDLPLLKSMASDVSKITKQKGCKFILNDLRKAIPVEDVFDIYNMPETAAKAGVKQYCKRALVVGDHASEFYFLETVFVNQGHLVKMFENINDAEDWLFGKKEKD